MANWKLFEPRGGVLRWKERNDFGIEDFVCYSMIPVEINLDVVVGEVDIIAFDEYKKECSSLRYLGS